jgi:hypothetical protein
MALAMLRWLLLLHAALLLLCTLAHHLLPASAAPADRLCAVICTALHALLPTAGSWVLPSAGWLRAHGGALFSPNGLHTQELEAATLTGRPYFEGWYYKAVLGDRSLVLIPGVTAANAATGTDGFGFVMVMDSEREIPPPPRVRMYRYPLEDSGARPPQPGEGDWAFVAGPNRFSAAGATLRLDGSALSCALSDELDSPSLGPALRWDPSGQPVVGCGTVVGELLHASLQPVAPSVLAPDVMGWLAYLPGFALPCRHGVVSFGHTVTGTLSVDGGAAVAVAGRGYLEKDWGTIFPKRWLWLQCNLFAQAHGEAAVDGAAASASLLVSIAELPIPAPQLPLTSFEGLLALLWIPNSAYVAVDAGGDVTVQEGGGGELWRFTTYNGARVESRNFDKGAGSTQIVLRTATHRLTVNAQGEADRDGEGLLARLWGPTENGFVPFIEEGLDAVVEVELRRVADGELVWAASGSHAGLELML